MFDQQEALQYPAPLKCDEQGALLPAFRTAAASGGRNILEAGLHRLEANA